MGKAQFGVRQYHIPKSVKWSPVDSDNDNLTEDKIFSHRQLSMGGKFCPCSRLNPPRSCYLTETEQNVTFGGSGGIKQFLKTTRVWYRNTQPSVSRDPR